MCAYIYSKKYILFKNCNLYACGGALQYFIACLKSDGKSNMCMPTYMASITGKSTVGTQYNNGEILPFHGFNKCHVSSILSIYSVNS